MKRSRVNQPGTNQKKVFAGFRRIKIIKESALAHQYLDGLNGVEIGASAQNPFGLDRAPGAYGNIDFDASQGENWQDSLLKPAAINIVASGDTLPFKDNTLDYIISSHVIEHFFDPVKTLKEWARVVRKGGYLFIIVPHKDRTFDSPRKETSVQELFDRHSGKLKISDYAQMTEEEMATRGYIDQGKTTSDRPDLFIGEDVVPDGWQRMVEDDHHWCVWTTGEFLELCSAIGLNVIESHDVDDKVGNGFTVVVRV